MEISWKPYFNLLRISDWGGYFLMSLFGFILAKGFSFPLSQVFIFFSLIFLFLGVGFSVNECFDTEEDKYNKGKLNVLISKQISFKRSLFFSLFLGVLGLSLSAIFGLKVFSFCLTGLLIGFFYSAPPLRFKSRPFLDLISHGFFAGLFLFFLPFLIFNYQITVFYWFIGLSIFYFSITLELRNHLEDYESDKLGGVNTTVCFLGYKKSEKLLISLAFLYPLILLPIFLLLSKTYVFLFLILTLVFLFFFSLRKNYKILKKYKIMDIYIILSFVLVSISSLISFYD